MKKKRHRKIIDNCANKQNKIFKSCYESGIIILKLQHHVPPFIVVVVYNYRIAYFVEVFLYQLAQQVKLMRKYSKGYVITKETLLKEITDLNGVRILHLYQQQFPTIHKEIMKKITDFEDWKLVESPKAYTWEKESQQFFEDLGIKTEVKDTYYTSVHYVVKPNNAKSDVTCEIQVRTLFEEIWGGN